MCTVLDVRARAYGVVANPLHTHVTVLGKGTDSGLAIVGVYAEFFVRSYLGEKRKNQFERYSRQSGHCSWCTFTDLYSTIP